MKALSLRGPFAYYERKSAENECRIVDLEAEVRRRSQANEDLGQRLVQAEANAKRLQDIEVPTLHADKERAQGIIDSLQAELARSQLERSEDVGRLSGEVASLTQELQKLSADSTVLRSELAKTVHQKQLTNSKLDQIRKKLGLTESEAKAFIQELDEARAASKAMREENKELVSDNMHLKQQVESRSQHCMTLIGENKRLLEQVAEVRSQLQKQQGELWQAKTEQHTSAAAVRQLQQASSKKALVVVREWPQGEPAAFGATSAAAGRFGSQNRPPWGDASSKKPSTTAAAGGKVVHVPVGVAPVTKGSDAVKASVVRQAMAVRQQRLESEKA